MNVFIYSLSDSKNIKWSSYDQDSQRFLSEIKLKCSSSIEIENSGLLLQADDETIKFLLQYSEDNDVKSRRNSRKIKAFANKLLLKECFYILNGDVVSDIIRLSAVESLRHENRLDIKAVHITFDTLKNSYAELCKHYTLYAFGFDNLLHNVGESDRDKRVCRFCGRTGRKNFKDDAHAIPEALGNKLLFCSEECDVCNHTLNIIEDNFIELMNVRRAIFRIKRKDSSSVPQIDGQDFAIRDDGSGNPQIFVMKEHLPDGWQTQDIISVRLNLKYKTTNENIYKSLVKIVIDLIPSQYLDEFKETIEWLTSCGHFIPDSLPSCYSACLPHGVFYEQPQLLLYVSNNGLDEMPFCFALLRIYDLCYKFIIPFAKSDKGKYRTDDSLKSFWSKIETEPSLIWHLQDTYEWWQSAPWIEFHFDHKSPFLKILPAKDPIFDKCRNRPLSQVYLFPTFDLTLVKIEFNTLLFRDYAKKIIISQEDLKNTNNDIVGITFTFDNLRESFGIDFSFIARSVDRNRSFFGVVISAIVTSQDFNNQIKYDDGGNFQVNCHFIGSIWDRVIAEASRQIDNKKRFTQFKNVNIAKLFTSSNKRFFRESMYVFTDSYGRIFRIPFKCMHEDMPQSKRDELISLANGR